MGFADDFFLFGCDAGGIVTLRDGDLPLPAHVSTEEGPFVVDRVRMSRLGMSRRSSVGTSHVSEFQGAINQLWAIELLESMRYESKMHDSVVRPL